jgi:DNA/RNA endonuclease YhcR with UshA esterase domain
MIKKLAILLTAGLLAAMTSLSASAHHSFAAAYNMENPIEITGTIVNVRLTNPHSYFFLDVKNDKGNVERWSFEAGTPSGMIRGGYSDKVIKTGDTVTISGFRARDESTNGMLTKLVTAEGKEYGMFGPREGGR